MSKWLVPCPKCRGEVPDCERCSGTGQIDVHAEMHRERQTQIEEAYRQRGGSEDPAPATQPLHTGEAIQKQIEEAYKQRQGLS